ncbi:hypothetical protein PROCOU_02584 [Listeria rocourtiae FSL F6-920]|nr:hypothetical protein PROCOU_02584 [Listeria rocourtiae FSL F6-920]
MSPYSYGVSSVVVKLPLAATGKLAFFYDGSCSCFVGYIGGVRVVSIKSLVGGTTDNRTKMLHRVV